MPANPIPRSATAAKRLGFKNQREVKHPLRGKSSAQKRQMVLVSLDRRGQPASFCHWDPAKGMWVCSDAADDS